MDESSERSDTETGEGEVGKFLKYSRRKGSDKSQRRVSSSPGSRDFIFDWKPKRDVYGFNYGQPRLVRMIINNYYRSFHLHFVYICLLAHLPNEANNEFNGKRD